ncbi:xanthine dehydrogenase family protein molybdopterin-binding subunit [Rhodoplanes sp. SY1]|uniref:xanthine dehydrogenase family protein molybdopterin-binding subunit n=1 Tax=Rhodoplanes sp. SY1 TaxID=3166646 RepID=UPI0038B5D09D
MAEDLLEREPAAVATDVLEKPRVAPVEVLRRSDEDLRLPAVAPPTTLPLEPPLVPQVGEQTRAVGLRAQRPDSRNHGLGLTRYIDDIALPGMLYAKIKRAGLSSARIKRIDVSKAEAMPGVKAVLLGREIPLNLFGTSIVDQPLLVDEIVRHAGDGVAAVAAVTEQIAQAAIDAIEVEYEPLPGVYDPIEALSPDAPKVHGGDTNIYFKKLIRRGDVEKGFAQSYRVYENRYTTPGIEHAPMEPFTSIADWDANGRLTVYATIGRITLARVDLAKTLRIPISRIRVIGTVVGGNFGGKNEIRHEPVLALLSKKAGRPVKGRFTRVEEFVASTIRHPMIMDYKTGVTKEGKIIARQIRMVLDGGAYCSFSETTLGKASILAPGPYQIENIHVEGCVVYTNKTTSGSMRGFGAPQVCFAYESQMDEIARDLGIDPIEIRLKNFFREGSMSATGQVLHSVKVIESLNNAARKFGWEAR